MYRKLAYLVANVKRPPTGSMLELHLDDIADKGVNQEQVQPQVLRYHVQRGKAQHLDDHCFQLLFQCLSLDNVIYIINCMLLEQRILIHTNVRTVLMLPRLRFGSYTFLNVDSTLDS